MQVFKYKESENFQDHLSKVSQTREKFYPHMKTVWRTAILNKKKKIKQERTGRNYVNKKIIVEVL